MFLHHVSAAEIYLQPAVCKDLDTLNDLPYDRIIVDVNGCLSAVYLSLDYIEFLLVIPVLGTPLLYSLYTAFQKPDLLVKVLALRLAVVDAATTFYALADSLQNAPVKSIYCSSEYIALCQM